MGQDTALGTVLSHLYSDTYLGLAPIDIPFDTEHSAMDNRDVTLHANSAINLKENWRMKTITVRNMEPSLAQTLKEVAKREKRSVNQLVIDILKKHCDLEKEKRYTRIHHDMDHLFGRWTQAEFDQIQGRINGERKIDPELW